MRSCTRQPSTWVRRPSTASYAVSGGAFRFDTQDAQLVNDENTASVLTEPAPSGDFVVETKMALDLPATGSAFSGAQAGIALYGGDDRYVKLVHAAVGDTRQTAFAQELPSAPKGWPRYGSTPVGPPDETTWLRIVKHASFVSAYTSRDGVHWVRGATYQYSALGSNPRIGLVSMGLAGFTARFDYVRVRSLAS